MPHRPILTRVFRFSCTLNLHCLLKKGGFIYPDDNTHQNVFKDVDSDQEHLVSFREQQFSARRWLQFKSAVPVILCCINGLTRVYLILICWPVLVAIDPVCL